MANQEITLAKRLLRGTIDIPATGDAAVTLGSLIDLLIDQSVTDGVLADTAAGTKAKREVVNIVFAAGGDFELNDELDFSGATETIVADDQYTEPCRREQLDTTFIKSAAAAQTDVFCKVYIGDRANDHQVDGTQRNYE